MPVPEIPMPVTLRVRAVLPLLAVLVLALHAAATPPAIFADKPFEEAKKAAVEAGKMLLVDFTASWCGPCKRMDRTTWVDPEVVKWIGEKAIAVQIDVDKDPEVSKAFSVSAMPTVVVLRGGEVFDRSVGYQSPSELLGWLKEVSDGRRRLDAVRAAADRKNPDGQIDVDAKYELARQLTEAGRLDEATESYVWLWQHMLEHKPSMYGVRLSFMRSDLEALARRHAPARERFAALRDETRKRMDADPRDLEAVVDWQALCQVVGDRKAVLVWFDAVRDDPERSAQIDRISDDLIELLVDAGRWSDAGKIVEDPVAKCADQLRMIEMGGPAMPDMPKEELEALHDSTVRFVVERNARLYASCLAAGRDVAAQKIAGMTFKAADTGSARVELVRVALKARQVRPTMRAWLDEAAAKGEDVTLLRERLEAAMAKAATPVDAGKPEPAR